MIEKTFAKLDEKIYIETLDNGLEVYLYPTKKTKNFYMTISVKYGARVLNYKLNNEVFDIIPGSAHFLEHKVMSLSENEEISRRINDFGSIANAWTSNYGTNYNLYGSINLKENLRLLLDIFYNIDINEKCVNEEKGIIGEEIDMYKDDINSDLYYRLYSNLFFDSYAKNTVVGERSDIEKITSSHLNRIYNHFYAPNNTFIIVCGDFDRFEIIDLIKEYIGKLNIESKELPKRIYKKDKSNVKVCYEEIKKDVADCRVCYAIKLSKSLFPKMDDDILKLYLSIILSNNFSSTSSVYERYKIENIMYRMSYGVNIVDDYIIISIKGLCNDGNLFIDNLKSDINNLMIKENEFERKKKGVLKNIIVDFDNIEDIEYNLSMFLMVDGKINFNVYNDVNDMNFESCFNILNILKENIKDDNVSIIKTIK